MFPPDPSLLQAPYWTRSHSVDSRMNAGGEEDEIIKVVKVLRRRARYLILNVICTFRVCVSRLIALTLCYQWAYA